MTNLKGSFDDMIKIFIPNASGYKTRRENRREKGTAKKTCFKYPRLLSWAVVQEIPFASNSSFIEEEALSLIHIPSPRDLSTSRMPSSA